MKNINQACSTKRQLLSAIKMPHRPLEKFLHFLIFAYLNTAFASASSATDLRVPEDYSSVSAALAASVNGDTVSVAPGTYAVGSVTMPSHTVVITGRGTPDQTIFTGNSISVAPGSGLRTISHLTLRSFSAYGAIDVRSTGALVVDVVFDQCVHGVFLYDGASIETTDCVFKNGVRGGYAYTSSSWTATRCTFVDNDCTGAYGGGAAFHVGSGGNFNDCVFLRNHASAGGAIGLSFSGNRTFNRCYFEGNTSPAGPVWWTEFGGSGTLSNSVLCGHSTFDISGGWVNGGGNQFRPEGCADCNSDGLADYGQILQGQLADNDVDGIPDVCEVITCHDSDLNLNEIVDGGDLGILLAFWGPVSPAFPRADINRDGVVNGADLGIVLAFWGPCPN